MDATARVIVSDAEQDDRSQMDSHKNLEDANIPKPCDTGAAN